MLKAQSAKQALQKKPHIFPAKRDGDPISETTPIPSEGQPVDGFHARITARAYELYVERGYREGYAEQDWLDAEREILNPPSPS
jgi:hypothetical protein